MTAFNFFSHGTQDLYPSVLLERQRGIDKQTVANIVIVYNLGALLGGVLFGYWSQSFGRRRAIIVAALLALPVVPFWALATSPVLIAASAFFMQFFVQGAWGVVPAHLNELSPAAVRGTFPGLAYQLGNLLAANHGDHPNAAGLQSPSRTRGLRLRAGNRRRLCGAVAVSHCRCHARSRGRKLLTWRRMCPPTPKIRSPPA